VHPQEEDTMSLWRQLKVQAAVAVVGVDVFVEESTDQQDVRGE
jgi:hypothetical protein